MKTITILIINVSAQICNVTLTAYTTKLVDFSMFAEFARL